MNMDSNFFCGESNCGSGVSFKIIFILFLFIVHVIFIICSDEDNEKVLYLESSLKGSLQNIIKYGIAISGGVSSYITIKNELTNNEFRELSKDRDNIKEELGELNHKYGIVLKNLENQVIQFSACKTSSISINNSVKELEIKFKNIEEQLWQKKMADKIESKPLEKKESFASASTSVSAEFTSLNSEILKLLRESNELVKNPAFKNLEKIENNIENNNESNNELEIHESSILVAKQV